MYDMQRRVACEKHLIDRGLLLYAVLFPVHYIETVKILFK